MIAEPPRKFPAKGKSLLRKDHADPVRLLFLLCFFSGMLCCFSAGAENLALNRKAAASSIQYLGVDAHWAFDGKSRTRWASRFSDPQWLMVDLGSERTVARVLISWEYAAAKKYRIQVSLDGKNWTDAAVKADGAGGIEELKFNPRKARYVRMYGENRLTKGGYSIFEFEVYSE